MADGGAFRPPWMDAVERDLAEGGVERFLTPANGGPPWPAGPHDDGPAIGAVIHGYAGGHFGRDSYDCRRVEALGTDWVITRNEHGLVEAVTNLAPADLTEYTNDFSYCDHGDTDG